MNKNHLATSKKIIFGLILVFSVLFSFSGVLAQTQDVFKEGVVPVTGKATGDYGLNDFVQLGINVAAWILGIVGSLALVMFIYGGFMFLISAGNSSSVEKAQKIIAGSVIGLIIVFTSYIIVRFSMQALGLDWQGKSSVPTATVDLDSRCSAKSTATSSFSCLQDPDQTRYVCDKGFCSGNTTRLCCTLKK